MAGRIIGCICCLMCAVPFWVIAKYSKNSKDPISFWSGDTSLKEKVKDVAAYNEAMAALYKKYAVAFAAAAIGCLLWLPLGLAAIGLDCTLGLYLVYRAYKKILKKYS